MESKEKTTAEQKENRGSSEGCLSVVWILSSWLMGITCTYTDHIISKGVHVEYEHPMLKHSKYDRK